MILASLTRVLAGSVRRQLIVGTVLTVSLVMSLFVWDMTGRQRAVVLEQQSDQAGALARSVATSSAVWVASRDYSGLQEIVDGLANYPDLRHAIVLDLKGQVLAHSDQKRRGLYLNDLPLVAEQKVLQRTASMVDVVTPVLLAGKQIGWSRIGLAPDSLDAKLANVTRSGFIHALIAIALSVIFSVLISRFLTRRLYAIQRVADAVEAGDSGVRAVVPGHDEAARLARHFNRMLDTLAQREKALAESKELLNLTQQLSKTGGWSWDVETQTMNWTEQTYRLYGLVAGGTAQGLLRLAADDASFYGPQDSASIEQAFRRCAEQGEAFDIEASCCGADRTTILVRITGEAIRLRGRIVKVIGTIMDISERQRVFNELEQHRNHLEMLVVSRTSELALRLAEMTSLKDKLEAAQDQLLQAEKMSSLGQLAAGVAHEINNPIGYVYSNLFTLENYLKDLFEIIAASESAADSAVDSQLLARIGAIKAEKEFDYVKSDTFALMSESKTGLDRVKKIVLDLKDFSRVGEAEWEWADMHKCLDSTLNIVGNELKYKCKVYKHYAEDLPAIRCIASQLNQIFMNLLVNAAHAIEKSGEISITTRFVAPRAIQIEIADSGRGIPAENLRRIFDPFFTTKPVGQGTGLGLSIAYGIAKKHRGSISVASVVGHGTTFTLWLPINPDELVDAKDATLAEENS